MQLRRARQPRRAQADERQAVDVVHLHPRADHLVQPRDDVDLDAELHAAPEEVDLLAWQAAARRRRSRARPCRRAGPCSIREVPPRCGGPSSGPISGSSSRKPITSRPYSGRRPSLRAISAPTRPAPTITRALARARTGGGRSTARARGRRAGTRPPPPRRRREAETAGARCRCAFEDEQRRPTRQRHEQDHAREVVGGRAHGLDLVVRVQPVAEREQHPGAEPPSPSAQTAGSKRLNDTTKSSTTATRARERGDVGEQQRAAEHPAAAPERVAGEGRAGRLRCSLDVRGFASARLFLHVRQIAR